MLSLTTGDGIAGRILVATPLTLVCPACIFGVAMAGSAPPGPSPPDPQITAGIAVFAFGFHPSGFFPLGFVLRKERLVLESALGCNADPPQVVDAAHLVLSEILVP